MCDVSFTSGYEFINETRLKKTSHIQNVLHAIHDCSRGHYREVENTTDNQL